ncbi:MAG TPA: ABC transporter permease [Chthoniobacterales bacterium]|nr:ABC transporter permease [Chthoniobacterales bacterium]
MLQEIRLALRQLGKNPLFALVAILTLALGIGATTAVFTLVDALLIKPLPYQDPSKIVLLFEHFRDQHLDAIPVSPPEFVDYKAQLKSFDKLAAFTTATYNLAGNENPERIFGATVSADLFPLLGVQPIRGRTFRPEECTAGRDDVVMISERLWRRKFDRDPRVLGSKIIADGKTFTVVGIMPSSFEFPLPLFNITGAQFGEQADIWQPLAFTDQEMKNRGSRSYGVIGRLAPNVSPQQAQAEIDTVVRQMRARFPKNYPQTDSFGATVYPLKEQVIGGMKSLLLILSGAVALVLLIACANLATMLLARASAREREMAIRVAVGASRARLLRQGLTESVVLAIFGGVAGTFLAIWAIELVKTLGTQTIPRLGEVSIDSTVLLVTLAIAIGTGLLFGLVPALATGKPDLTEALKEGGRGSTTSRRHNQLRNGLVIVEVALALVLLTGAGLLLKSFVRLENVNPGFNPENVLTAEISLPPLRYPDDKAQANFFTELERRVSNLPGVSQFGLTTILPMSGVNSDSSFGIEGQVYDDTHPSPDEEIRIVSPGYFKALQIPLLQGRFFTAADKLDAPYVVLINHALTQRYWPNEQPIGRRIQIYTGKGKASATVVGIVGDIHHKGLDHPVAPEYYVPLAQLPYSSMILAVRSSQDPRTLTNAIRQTVQAIDPTLPIAHIRTLDQVIADSVAPRKLSVVLLAVFAAVALVLAAVGIYGVMSFLVVQRTHEIGVRMALGAQRSDVLRLVIIQTGRLIGVGTLLGLVTALFSTSLLRTALYQVSAIDLPTFLGVTFVLAAVAFLASYIPARRATRADPMVALGHG